jgi:hypothetical protein
MSRPTRFEHNQWLGDKRTLRVHNLDNIQPSCGLDELLASERYASFGPDLLAEARNRGYRAHRPCVGRSEAGTLPQ